MGILTMTCHMFLCYLKDDTFLIISTLKKVRQRGLCPDCPTYSSFPGLDQCRLRLAVGVHFQGQLLFLGEAVCFWLSLDTVTRQPQTSED